MAIPLTPGKNPEDVEIPKDSWVKIFSGVNTAKITNLFNATDTLWLTYVKTGDTTPVGLDLPKWKLPFVDAKFNNSISNSDVYAYAVEKNLRIRLES